MRKPKLKLAFAGGPLLVAVLACNFSTTNLSSLKLGKDKTVSAEASKFGPSDTVYAVATVANAPGKVKVKGVLNFEDVPGKTKGPIEGWEKTLELDGSGTATYTLSPPTDGWPKGTYKLDVTLTNESGRQKDQKSATFSIS